jgi:GNAT superfamily N-acetyltransferase
MQPAPIIVIRQTTEADGPAIEAMFARCSLESRYGRFLAPLPTIPLDHLSSVLAPAPGRKEAWVGVTTDDPEQVVALGSWARRGTDAELGLIVEDSWQHRGVGSSFLRLLAQRAWEAGVSRLTASVLTESRHVFQMLRRVLGPASTRFDGYISQVTIERS